MTEIQTQSHARKVGLLMAIVGLLAVGAILAAGSSSAQITEGNVTLDQPDNQTVDVALSFSGSTTATVSLERSGTQVASSSVSGASGNTEIVTVDTTGLSFGDYYLNVSATDETVVTHENTTITTLKQSVLDVDKNETVAVDVEFDATQTTTADVSFKDSNGASLNSTTLSFDPVEAEEGTGFLTEEWEAPQAYDNVTVEVVTSPASGYKATFVEKSSSLFGGGTIAGASSTQVTGFIAVVVGLLLARNRGWF